MQLLIHLAAGKTEEELGHCNFLIDRSLNNHNSVPAYVNILWHHHCGSELTDCFP